jgi:membrane associated rhomboid family serine protease
MTPILTKLRELFQKGNMLIRLIYINTGVFLILTLMTVFFQLFNKVPANVLRLVELPASFSRFIEHFWTLITYMFIHINILHLLFNMLWLYWFGSMFLYFFSAKHLRGLYVIGGIFGGIVYLIAYNVFPYFQPVVAYSSMIGASASVLAIVVAVACREPNHPVRLFLLGSIRLKYIALMVVIFDLLSITSTNSGGHIAHLGGAFAGYCFAAGLSKGIDITGWMNKLIDGLLALFNKTTYRRKRKPSMKAYHYTQRTPDYEYNANKKAQSERVDKILDKLKRSGYESLTTEEKKRLFDAGKE